ncbi:MAG: hypothetical protein ACYCSI_06895 [Solirubrobacteraceae bacterium]
MDPGRLRLGIQRALAALWILDALLQLQGRNFSPALVNDTILGNVENQPAPIAASIRAAAHLLEPHHVLLNIAIVSVQLTLGIALLFRASAKPGLACSVVWALGIWWFGEGFGGLLAGEASLLAGAPGAAALYALVAMAIWPSDDTAPSPTPDTAVPSSASGVSARPSGASGVSARPSGASGVSARPRAFGAAAPKRAADAGLIGTRMLTRIWAALWIGGALLRVAPFWFPPVYALEADLQNGIDREPHWLLLANEALRHIVSAGGLATVIVLAVVEAGIGIGSLLPRRRRAFLFAGAAVALLYWAVGQHYGELFSGSATDVGSGPLFVMLALLLWPLSEPTAQLAGDQAPGALSRVRGAAIRSATAGAR